MKFVITTASKHGSTQQIGQAIAEQISKQGHDVEIVSPDNLNESMDADGLIIGSAIYMGGWLKELTNNLEVVKTLGARMPVWAFSSGPLGEPPVPEGEPERVVPIVAELSKLPQFQGHQVFAGSLDRSKLKASEKLILKMVKAPAGDFRPWSNIDAWANQIATTRS